MGVESMPMMPGEYFVGGEWAKVEPNDHALNNYHNWLRNNEQSAAT